MSHTDVTPYRAAQIATAVLRKVGRLAEDEEVAPQTMYGLARPGKTSNVSAIATVPGSSPILFVGDAFAEWLEAAKKGQGRGRAAVNMQSLIDEYDADTAEQDTDEEGNEPEVDENDPDMQADLDELEAFAQDGDAPEKDEQDEDENVPTA